MSANGQTVMQHIEVKILVHFYTYNKLLLKESKDDIVVIA